MGLNPVWRSCEKNYNPTWDLFTYWLLSLDKPNRRPHTMTSSVTDVPDLVHASRSVRFTQQNFSRKRWYLKYLHCYEAQVNNTHVNTTLPSHLSAWANLYGLFFCWVDAATATRQWDLCGQLLRRWPQRLPASGHHFCLSFLSFQRLSVV